MTRRLLSLFISLILSVGYLQAGGPLIVTGIAAQNPGQAFIWDVSAPIRYTVDGGPLSVAPSGQVVISNSEGIARVQGMFQTWQSVSTTAISYSYAGKISAPGLSSSGDVKSIQDFDAVMGTCKSGSQNPIVFDADGSLLRALGLDPLVIGFSGSCKLDPQAGHIVSAFVDVTGVS